jgi:hypothetical protein
MSERMEQLWREDPSLVIMIWIMRYLTLCGCALIICVAIIMSPFFWVGLPPAVALHYVTWVAWRRD